MLIGIAYLALFLAAGLLLARWAVPDGSLAVAVPLGCGFCVSLLAALPAGFALVCGFTLRAVWLAAAGAALLCAVLIFAGRGHIRFARDPDRGAMWLCLLPVLAVTLYLLHTHVLHKVNGTLHTGQSCYGDMPMHLGFIEYIAQSGQFPPRYPLLAGAHRLPVFVRDRVQRVPSAGGRAAGGVSAADGARLCQRIRHVLAVGAADAGQRGQSVSGVLSVFHGQRVRFCLLFKRCRDV